MERHTVGHFRIGTGLPGAVTFTCALVLNDGHATGSGTITQAISPPLDLDVQLKGTVASLVWGADDTLIIALTGQTFNPRLPLPPYPVNSACTIVLSNSNPGQDKASLSYMDGASKVTLTNLPVQVKWHQAPN